jgi:hypothetical protein
MEGGQSSLIRLLDAQRQPTSVVPTRGRNKEAKCINSLTARTLKESRCGQGLSQAKCVHSATSRSSWAGRSGLSMAACCQIWAALGRKAKENIRFLSSPLAPFSRRSRSSRSRSRSSLVSRSRSLRLISQHENRLAHFGKQCAVKAYRSGLRERSRVSRRSRS